MRHSKPTLKDVAKLAGVSASTVSRAVSDHPDIGRETMQKVKAAIRELGYRPSMLARGLVGGRTNTLGLLISHITNPFYPLLASAIEEYAHERDYVVFLANTLDDPQRSQDYLERLTAHGVDGIIHASVGADESVVGRFLGSNVPIVFANRSPSGLADVDMVVPDNRGGGRQAAKHLIELGHRRVAFVAGPAYATGSRERKEGFEQGLAEAGLTLQENLVVSAEFSRQSGHEAGIRLLRMPMRPSAVFVVNDVVAMGVLDAALQCGMQVPQELSVIGFGNIWAVGEGVPRLTTVSAPINDMGRLACERLIDAITDERHVPQQTILPTEVVIRETTARLLA